jgi:hypothetical protein
VDSTTGLNGEMAWIEWEEAVGAVTGRNLGCSSSEAQVLAIAASIAEGVPLDLGNALTGLDDHNVSLVAEAVAHASGRRGLVGVSTW